MFGYLLQRIVRKFNPRLNSYYHTALKSAVGSSNYPIAYGFSIQTFFLSYLAGVLPTTSGASVYENFTIYTLVQSAATYSVDGTELNLTDTYPDNEESYLYKDFGADYFKRNFTINFELKVDVIVPDDGADLAGVLITANLLGNRSTVGGNGGPTITMACINGVADQFHINCGDNRISYGVHKTFNVGVQYYCTIVRTYGDPGSVLLYVYDDAARTNLVEAEYGMTNNIDEVSASITYRYLMLGQSNRVRTEDSKWTYTISNVEIISNI